MTARLTPARLKGLRVLALDGKARYSNQSTSQDHRGHRCVYWQTADWLIATGLAEQSPHSADIAITQLGRSELARAATEQATKKALAHRGSQAERDAAEQLDRLP